MGCIVWIQTMSHTGGGGGGGGGWGQYPAGGGGGSTRPVPEYENEKQLI